MFISYIHGRNSGKRNSKRWIRIQAYIASSKKNNKFVK